MTRPDATTTTLVIADWHSWCSACCNNAEPSEIAHRTVPQSRTVSEEVTYLSGQWPDGCGAIFEQVAVEADASNTTERHASTLRRDLPYVGRWPR